LAIIQLVSSKNYSVAEEFRVGVKTAFAGGISTLTRMALT
jgi:hypothetical protein